MFDGLDLGKRNGGLAGPNGGTDRQAAGRKVVAPVFVEPIGWHGFPPSRLSSAPYTIWKNQPPVEQQLSRQVRSATGMTWGRQSADGAKVYGAFAFGPRIEKGTK